MITEDKCKIAIDSVIYRARVYKHDDGSLDHYAVLNDRRIIKGGGWFSDYRQAVMFMLRVAFNDVVQLKLEMLP